MFGAGDAGAAGNSRCVATLCRCKRSAAATAARQTVENCAGIAVGQAVCNVPGAGGTGGQASQDGVDIAGGPMVAAAARVRTLLYREPNLFSTIPPKIDCRKSVATIISAAWIDEYPSFGGQQPCREGLGCNCVAGLEFGGRRRSAGSHLTGKFARSRGVTRIMG